MTKDLRNKPEFNPLMRASLDACVKCTICETQCPVAAVTPLFPGPKYVGPQAERFRKGMSVDHTIDYCSSCGTCTLVCPQGVKVAELNNVARAAMKQQNGRPLRDVLISNTMFMGKAMTPVAPLANWALRQKPIRQIVEKTFGIHHEAPMPVADGFSFEKWFKKHTRTAPAPTKGKIVFFHGCAGEFFETTTSIRSVQILEHLGYEVLVPPHGCCGLAQQSNGLYDGAKKLIRKLAYDLNVPGDDLTIVGSSGSCVGMVKHEAREILGIQDEELTQVSRRIWDISEFLLDLYDRGELDLDNLEPMNLTVTYHAPCQLKSTGIGTPGKQLLDKIPGLTVHESGATCCGIAGTYGLKREKYDIAQAVGKTAFDKIKGTNSDLVVSGTETCRWQLEKGGGKPAVHPIYLLFEAMGLKDS